MTATAGDREAMRAMLDETDRRIERFERRKDWRKLRREREWRTSLLVLLERTEGASDGD